MQVAWFPYRRNSICGRRRACQHQAEVPQGPRWRSQGHDSGQHHPLHEGLTRRGAPSGLYPRGRVGSHCALFFHGVEGTGPTGGSVRRDPSTGDRSRGRGIRCSVGRRQCRYAPRVWLVSRGRRSRRRVHGLGAPAAPSMFCRVTYAGYLSATGGLGRNRLKLGKIWTESIETL